MQNSKIPLLTIVGPTAVGKTSLAIEIARHLKGEIISLDSRQIYTGMAIGTAQPTIAEMAVVPHHLVAFRSPDQKITAGEFSELVAAVVEDIRLRGNQPILCGGAGLYYRAIAKGIFSASDSDLEIRARLEEEYATSGPDALMRRLEQLDPIYAAQVHPNNRKRLIRALEIYEITGQAPSEHFDQQSDKKYPFNLFTVLLTRTMEDLEWRIRQRIAEMLSDGWIAETSRLLKYRRDGSFHAMDSIGYRQIMDYLDKKIDYSEMVDLIVLKTRQYAKRQLTWFRQESIDLELDLSGDSNLTDYTDKTIAEFMKLTVQ
ncbi:MAG: tRNA (adenosine(37)-N6)-dimethylallyltransferase MiaA [Candidatus Marinimicrobia bacterium]|nr:tRNA (adenosine(37)-N6)-dimethylallyltransferase MiaA [Candidatus Neomarinimicrobiota bacterium]